MRQVTSAARDLDDLIGEITVDCHDEDEALSGFEVAFDDDVGLPLAGTVVGEDVQVLSIGRDGARRELIATCARAGLRYRIALLDIDLIGDAAAIRLIAAYRRWLEA